MPSPLPIAVPHALWPRERPEMIRKFIPKSKHIGLLSCPIPVRRRLIVAPVSAVSREGDLRPMDKGKTLRALKTQRSGLKQGASMPFTRTVPMLALAREALERFDT